VNGHRCNAPDDVLDEPAQRHWECECGKRYLCVRYLRSRRPRWIWKQIPAGSPLNEHFDAAVSSSLRQNIRANRLGTAVVRDPRGGPDIHVWQLSEERYNEVVRAASGRPGVRAAVATTVQACGEAVDATRAALVASEGIAWQRGDHDPMVLIEAAQLLMKELSEHFEPER
jgi:hypothetical protein